MRSIEHVKRFTTTGMATDQGKTSNVNALAIVADRLGTPIPSVGTTTFRPPYVPLTFGAIVGHGRGRLFDVVRKTPMHAWAEANGAVFEDVGNWKRAWYFPRAAEDMHAAVARECKQVREACGLLDASTLGKIDVQGKDARTFLNLVYSNAWSKLAPGKCRYGFMLRDDGYVYDDGVTACIADDHFHMTTTTGGRAQGARLARGSVADGMARPRGLSDLGDRAMGDHGAQRPECAQAARAAGERRHLHRETAAYGLDGGDHRRCRRPDLPHQLHR